jgi:hypothetical protein
MTRAVVYAVYDVSAVYVVSYLYYTECCSVSRRICVSISVCVCVSVCHSSVVLSPLHLKPVNLSACFTACLSNRPVSCLFVLSLDLTLFPSSVLFSG